MKLYKLNPSVILRGNYNLFTLGIFTACGVRNARLHVLRTLFPSFLCILSFALILHGAALRLKFIIMCVQVLTFWSRMLLRALVVKYLTVQFCKILIAVLLLATLFDR